MGRARNDGRRRKQPANVQDMKDLKDKFALVTGAASGIGLGIARALAKAGTHIALSDIRAEPLEAARREIEALGVRAIGLALDVSDREAVRAAARRVEAEFGKLHILCNNAGVAFAGTAVDEATDRDWDWVIGVNLYGPINFIQAFVPLIKRHGEGGHVVNTASIAGFQIRRDSAAAFTARRNTPWWRYRKRWNWIWRRTASAFRCWRLKR